MHKKGGMLHRMSYGVTFPFISSNATILLYGIMGRFVECPIPSGELVFPLMKHSVPIDKITRRLIQRAVAANFVIRKNPDELP